MVKCIGLPQWAAGFRSWLYTCE